MSHASAYYEAEPHWSGNQKHTQTHTYIHTHTGTVAGTDRPDQKIQMPMGLIAEQTINTETECRINIQLRKPTLQQQQQQQRQHRQRHSQNRKNKTRSLFIFIASNHRFICGFNNAIDTWFGSVLCCAAHNIEICCCFCSFLDSRPRPDYIRWRRKMRFLSIFDFLRVYLAQISLFSSYYLYCLVVRAVFSRHCSLERLSLVLFLLLTSIQHMHTHTINIKELFVQIA